VVRRRHFRFWRGGAKLTHRRLALSHQTMVPIKIGAAETYGDVYELRSRGASLANFQKVKFVEDFVCPCVSAAFRFQNSSFQKWGTP
jgi:hypothetical protein